MSLHPLEEREHGVGGRQPLVCGRLGQVVAHDPERVSQALQRDDGVLVSDVIADIDDPNPGNKSTSHLAAPGSILGIPKDISLGKTNLMLQRFIDGPA